MTNLELALAAVWTNGAGGWARSPNATIKMLISLRYRIEINKLQSNVDSCSEGGGGQGHNQEKVLCQIACVGGTQEALRRNMCKSVRIDRAVR